MGGTLSLVYVLAGGAAGTLARWYLSQWIQSTSGVRHFPLGTLLINLSGSFVLGLVARLGADATAMSPQVRDGLTVGLCGAFTTMSTFSYESLQLLGEGDYARAGLYMGGTVVGCLAAVVVGSLVASRIL
ncbi:MAG TPA: fluoride efflux transporter CrcB [Gemmatimonadales bacterium]|nr:fluoride efflux transporter CrcB [Gemmatimonadales bacterium]